VKSQTLPTQAPCRVLLVDDHEAAAQVVERLLTSEGYLVHRASDGAAAIFEVHEFEPDAILMDLEMPNMGGIEAARHIHAQCVGRRPVIIALTGRGTAADRKATADAGFDGHLVKPVPLATVVETLRRLTRSNA
jgi:CheY-like chemotaxis protein